MINKKDILYFKVPYPNINSGLANCPHYYICYDSNEYNFKTVKCQSYKPLRHKNGNNIIINPSKKNLFKKQTLVDCSQVFKFIDCHIFCEEHKKYPSAEDSIISSICNKLYDNTYIINEFSYEQLEQIN